MVSLRWLWTEVVMERWYVGVVVKVKRERMLLFLG
jgi:hypothetical protein